MSGETVSVVLITRDRPQLLAVSLDCYDRQTHPDRELVVVDDGDRFPVNERAVNAVGGRLIRVPPDTPLGTKLNIGVDASTGSIIQRMDDDDWYGPDYIRTFLDRRAEIEADRWRPSLLLCAPFTFFHVLSWSMHRTSENVMAAATFQFRRDDWERCRFRDVRRGEDMWFAQDTMRAGFEHILLDLPRTFVALRHTSHLSRRQTRDWSVDDYVTNLPLATETPEELFPSNVLTAYSEIHASA